MDSPPAARRPAREAGLEQRLTQARGLATASPPGYRCPGSLDRLATTDRLHGDSRFELGTVGAALAHWWEPRSGAVPRLRG